MIKSKKHLLIIILLFIVWLIPPVVDFLDSDVRVWILDVGQGDSVLIVTPKNKTILIDGGAGDYVLSQLGEVLPPWVNSIDIVVLTHAHSDHYLGLLDVLNRFNVDELWWNPINEEVYGFEVFIDLITELESEDLNIVEVCQGSFFVEDDVRLDVLWPECVYCEDFCSSWDGNLNNDSIVILLDYLDFEILLTGDAEVEVESEILDSLKANLGRVEVLKAGHHCSKTATSEELLNVLQVDLVVCSCGQGNKFGHPHEETLLKLENLNIEHLRTDISGRVFIKSDGYLWTFSSEKG